MFLRVGLFFCTAARLPVWICGFLDSWRIKKCFFLSANQFWFPYQRQETTEEPTWVMGNRDMPTCEFMCRWVARRERDNSNSQIPRLRDVGEGGLEVV